jgi:AbrB family looped-hinge helix DNA binding protein
MTISTLSSKNQVTLPSDLRQALGLKAGDLVAFTMEGKHAVLRTVAKADVLALAGIGRGALKAKNIEVKGALAQRARTRYHKAG